MSDSRIEASQQASEAPDASPQRRAKRTITGERQYWIGVVSKDHVERAQAGGFAQLNHGKAGALQRLRQGDGLVYYSPRVSYPRGEPLQAFTAIGRVRSGTVYQTASESDSDFRPFRIDVEYMPADCVPIKPLIEHLSFIRSKTHWGATFRFGYVRIAEPDFARIAAAMGCSFEAHFGASRAV